MELGQSYVFRESGILAFDGDRLIEVSEDDSVEVSVRRDGPWIIEPSYVLEVAAQHGLFSSTRA
jgi:tRNA(Phe) wybutosine-synthesizing methylase Tyw3